MRAASTVGTLRQNDRELTISNRRLSGVHIERTAHAYGACETAELALDEMKRLRFFRQRRRLLSGNQHDARAEEHAQGCDGDSGNIHHDLDRRIGFEDVERGMTFTCVRPLLGRKRGVEFFEDLADVTSEFADFNSGE